MKLTRMLRALPGEAARAFARTPLEVLLGIAAWVGLAIAIENTAAEDSWLRLAITVQIALPLVYATSVLHATGTISRWTRWLAAGIAITAAALYGFFVFDPDLAAEVWRAVLLIAAACLTFLATPLVLRPPPGSATTPPLGNRRARTHLFAIRLAVRVSVVGLYALALFAGLAAALGAVNGLFELDLPDKLYSHLAALIFVLMPPWAIAAGLPTLIAPPAPWGALTLSVLRRVGLFLLAPLITVYLLIVYAYTIRMFVTGEIPSNLVSPVVLGAGVLTIIATILLEPLYAGDDARGLTRFLRLLPALLLPLCVLALWAVLIRVEQYGWTEFRYIRVLAILLLGTFAAAGSWRLVRGRRPPLAALPAVTAAILLIAAIGPLAAPAVAYRSQTQRLAALIPPASERSAAHPTAVGTDTLQEATNLAAYLRDHFGWDALQPYLPADATRPVDRSPTSLATTLGLTEKLDDALPRIIYAALPEATGIPGTQGGTLYLVDYQRPSPPHLATPARPITPPQRPPASTADTTVAPALRTELDTTGTTIAIHTAAGPSLTADLADIVRQLIASTSAETGEPVHNYNNVARRVEITARSISTPLTPATAITPLFDHTGQQRGQLLLRNLTIRATADSAGIQQWNGIVLLQP